MQLANFKVYTSKDLVVYTGLFNNYQGLNVLLTVFSEILTVFNTLLLSFIIENRLHVKLILCFVYVIMFIILIISNFDFSEVSFICIVTLSMAIILLAILIPSFAKLSDKIFKETNHE